MSIDADDWLDRFAPAATPARTGSGESAQIEETAGSSEDRTDKTRALLQRRGGATPPDPTTRVDGVPPNDAADDSAADDGDWLERFAPVRTDDSDDLTLVGPLADSSELTEDELLNRALGLEQGVPTTRRSRGRRRERANDEPSIDDWAPTGPMASEPAELPTMDEPVGADPQAGFFEADEVDDVDDVDTESDAVMESSPMISVQDSQLFDAAGRQSPVDADGSINWETPHLFDLGEFGRNEPSPNQVFSNDPQPTPPEPPAEWVLENEGLAPDPLAAEGGPETVAHVAPPPWPEPPALGPDGIPLLEPLTTSLPRPPVEWGWEEAWPDGSPKDWDDTRGLEPSLRDELDHLDEHVVAPSAEVVPANNTEAEIETQEETSGAVSDGSDLLPSDRPAPPPSPLDAPTAGPVGWETGIASAKPAPTQPDLPWDSVFRAGAIDPPSSSSTPPIQDDVVPADALPAATGPLDAAVDEPRWSQAMETWERGAEQDSGASPAWPSAAPAQEVVTLQGPADASTLPGLEPHPSGAVQDRPEGLRANPATRVLIDWLPVVIGAFLVAVLVRFFVFQAYYIPSTSMTPTLEVSDRVLVNKLSYSFGDVDRGDVVVFKRPAADGGTEDLIKRVIGLPGETVVFRNGDVFVDGQLVEETYLLDERSSTTRGPIPNCVGEAPDECLVPAGHVLVLGDNRVGSSDGRVFGPISTDEIVGRAFVRVWPLNDLGLL